MVVALDPCGFLLHLTLITICQLRGRALVKDCQFLFVVET
jgi:hypothetical protein